MAGRHTTIGYYLHDQLNARQTVARDSLTNQLVFQVFTPEVGNRANINVDLNAFKARYGFDPRKIEGSPIGEGRIPDRQELHWVTRRADNPLNLVNHERYEVSDVDIADLRYVARNRRPIWESPELQNLFGVAAPVTPSNPKPPVTKPEPEPVKPPVVSVDPPTIPLVPSLLSPAAKRAEEIFTILSSQEPTLRLPFLNRDFMLTNRNWLVWKPFVVEALRAYRQFRKLHLGDRRPIPPEDVW